MKRASEYFKKYVILFYGVVFMSLGIAIMHYSELGNAPVAVFNDGISRIFGISIGTANILVCVGLIFMAILVDRRLVSVGTFILSFGAGVLMDFCIEMVGYIFPEISDFSFKIICIIKPKRN